MAKGVVWEERAIEQLLELLRIEPRSAGRVKNAVYQFARHSDGDVKKLQGEQRSWRLRVGKWRVVFELEADFMYVRGVDDRKDAYS